MGQRLISVAEISKHNIPRDLWIVVDGAVYDITAFAPEHPGGLRVLLQYAGRDATAAYSEVHALSLIKTTLPSTSHIGILDANSVSEEWATPPIPTFPKQNVLSKPPLDTLICAHDFELAASKSFAPKAWAFVSSAATDCYTKDRNSSMYSQISLRPRVLRNVSEVTTSTSMLGHKIRAPIFCSPTSMGKLIHPEGERELGRACRDLGIPQIVSTSSSYSLAEVMNAIEEDKTGGSEMPVFFQLYMDKNRSKSEKLLKHVKDRGVKAIFLTVDAPITGKREADERIKADESVSTPMSGVQAKNDKKGGALGRIMGSFIDASTTWEDISWIRICAPGLPIVLKGVQTAMDAVMAMEAGVDGILVSNHGGRSLDTAPATILVLLELQKCCPEVFDRMEVYVDGGITRGTDIFKALCLGAKAVGIGRGCVYALNYGKAGVEHLVETLNDELETTMRMCGITSLDQVHPGLLQTGAVDHLVPNGEEHPYAQWRPKPRSKL
ncbi:FMN-dependent dehydrogenase-domain-containing protein [Pseudomassariella vexata]|uniref:L-lactate dehydrogenase (cytochrome) n=1 Tax=Pseudomassariella vexata TaxID=1141098 RepID=A0A1Y2ELV7_9PEZI|nr:FMN-dependent dehydrogenase-domain-containing protein [Pseudomassariella vexata]ORY71835.1 FMN-dependent dehydrogenase-domain-containing protein [Pseudomassariella vexata]